MKKSFLTTITIVLICILIGTIITIIKITQYNKEFFIPQRKDSYDIELETEGIDTAVEIAQLDKNELILEMKNYMIYNNLENANHAQYIKYEKNNKYYILCFQLNDEEQTIIYVKTKQNQKEYYNFFNEKTSKNNIAIKNITELLKIYDGEIIQNEIENDILLLADYNLKQIYNETKDYSTQQKTQYYEDKKQDIYDMGIYTKEDFLQITEQANGVYAIQDAKLYSARIEIVENTNEKDEHCSFNLFLTYNNNKKINLKCYITERQNNIIKIKYTSNE